jgi:hypothetical protein
MLTQIFRTAAPPKEKKPIATSTITTAIMINAVVLIVFRFYELPLQIISHLDDLPVGTAGVHFRNSSRKSLNG